MNDICSNGTCVGVAVPNGTICASFISCTTIADACENGICTPTSTVCDDGNSCTSDYCDVANNVCVHTALPEEVLFMFLDQVTLEWNTAVGASISNTYRGTIPAEGLSSRSPVYDHTCFESDDAQLNGANVSVDVEDPPVGTSFYYLVDGESSSCGEGSLGTASDGTQRTPVAFCPTPPP